MKRFLSLLTVIAFVGITNVWGTQVTSTFTNKSLGVGSGQPTWASSTTPTAYESDRGVSWSKASTNLTNTSLSSNTITEVVVTASANGTGGNITVTVGGTSFSSSNASISNGDSKVTHTFTHTGATGNIVVGVPKGGKSIWIKSISVTYSTATCSNKLNLTKTAPTNGSYDVYKGSVSNSNLIEFTNNAASIDNCGSGATTIVVVPTANTHYYVSAVEATNIKAQTEITESDGQYSIQYAQGSNVSSTITVTFAEDAHSSIVLNDANGDGDAITSYYVGDNYTLPTSAANCTGKTFVGWSTVEVSKTNTKPTSNFYEPGAEVTLGASHTFYAVYAKVTESTTKFKRVTSVSDITEGEKVAIVNNSTSKILGLNDGGTAYTAESAPSETSSQINKPSNNNLWTASKSGDYWEFTNCNTTTKKIATSAYASPSALNVSTQTYTKFEIGANTSSTNMFYLRLYNGSSMTNCALQYYNTNSVWQVYAPQSSGNPTYSSNGNVAAKLYVPVKTYSAYATGCEACTENPTVGAAGLKSEGAYGLDGVEVSVSGMYTGSDACEWTDYGFYWGTSANKKANKKQVGTNGSATSFEATLGFEAPTQLATSTTYYYCAYGKNSKSGAEIVYGTENSFTPQSVTFKNGDAVVSTVILNKGSKVSAPGSNPSKTGWTFSAWQLSGSNYDFNSEVNSDLVLDAYFTINSYDLTWTTTGDDLEGDYTGKNGKVEFGTTIVAPNTPTRTGYTFNAWSPSVAETMPAANTEYTATWNTISYSITYNTNGGDAIAAGNYNIETNTFSLPTPTKTGYTFVGWKANSGLTGDNVTSIAKGSTGNKEYWAAWTANTYKVVFKANGGTGNDVEQTGFTYDESKTLTSFETIGFTAPEHKYFLGWSTNSSATTATYVDEASVSNLSSTNNGSANLFAIWKDHTYTNFRTRCCTAWDDPTLGWNTYNLAAGGDHATLNTIEETTHGTLTFESSNESVITVDASTGEVTPVGAGTAKVIATWVDGDEVYCEKVIESSTFSVTGNVVVTFKKNGGTGTDDQTQNIPLNTSTALKTLATVGYTAPSCQQFVGWNTDKDATTATYTDGANVTLTEGITLYAIWEDITYTITKGTNTGAATFDVASSVTCGEDLTITCAADDDHEGNPTVTADGTHGDITVNSATSVTIANVQSAMTVTISYAAKVTHALKFMNYENGEYKATSTKNLYAGAAYGELPTLASNKACDGTSTTFKGWTTSKIEIKTATEPTYISAETVMGSEDVEVYAVWAKATPTGTYTETKIQTLQYDTWTYDGSTTDKSNDSYRMFHENAYVQSAEFDLSKLSKVNIYGGYFGGKAYKTMTIDDGTNTWKDVTLQESNSQTNKNEFTGGNALTGTGSLYIRSTCGAAGNNPTGIRLTKIEIFINEPNIGYSDYVTGCRDDVRTITIADNIVGGTVTASASSAFEGDEITLTKTPASGYNFGSWAVKDADQGNVTVTNDAFTMPNKNVTVNAVFTPKPMTGLTLSETSVTEDKAHNTKTLTVTAYAPNDLIASQKTLNWTSSNEAVATVADGVVTYKAAGTATITASWTQDENVKATCEFTIYQWNLDATTPYEVTTAPGTTYTDASTLDKSAVVIKANYVRSDDNTKTQQETLGVDAWTAKLGGTVIANNYAFKETDNGKALAAYVGENKLWEQTITVTAVPKDEFVVGIWTSEVGAIAKQVGSYTMPDIDDQEAGEAASCKDHNIFVGWTTDPDDPKDANIIAGGTTGQTASNTKYYAVWAKEGTVTKTLSYGWETGESTTGWTISGTTEASYKRSGEKSGKFSSEASCIATASSYATPKSLKVYYTKATTNTNTDNLFKLQYYNGSSWVDITSGKNFNQLTRGSFEELSATLTANTYKNKSFRVYFNNATAAGLLDDIEFVYETTGASDYITDCTTRYDIIFYKDQSLEDEVDKKTYKEGKVIAMPGDLGMTKEYHTFVGWRSYNDYSASVDKIYAEGEEYTVTDEDFIYGEWDEWSKGTVTFKNGEAVIETQSNVYRETNYTTPAAPEVSGKLFQGWTDGENTYEAGVELTMPNPAVDITYNAIMKDVLPTPSTPDITAADLANGEWILVTSSSQIKEGDVVIVASTVDAGSFALSTTQETKYRAQTTATISGDKLTATDAMAKLFVQVGYGDGQFALYAINGTTGYLYYPGSGNELRTGNNLSTAASWMITIDENSHAVIQNSAYDTYSIRYNKTSGQVRFSCYTQGQYDVALYKWTKKISGTTNVSDITLTDAVIVENGGTVVVNTGNATVENITIENGGTVVVSKTDPEDDNIVVEIDNIVVEDGGSVEVEKDMAVETNTLTLQTTSSSYSLENDGTSGQLKGEGTITVTGDLFLEIKLRDGDMDDEASRKWYCISAPFNVDINNGFFWGDGTPMVLNTHFQLFKWDGDRRAKGISGWQRVSGTMQAGVAYFIGFDDDNTNNQNTIKLKANTNNNTISNKVSINAPGHNSEVDNDTYGNWNGLANPNYHHIALNQNVQVFDYNEQKFNPYDASESNYVVGTSFFIQFAGNIGITELHEGKPFYAPKRESETYSYCVRIRNTETGLLENRIFVKASENASSTYDEEKEMLTLNDTASTIGALIWTSNYGGKHLAIEEAPLINSQASYALTMFTKKSGSYSIELGDADDNANIYLTKNGAIIWNLTKSPYTIELEEGTTEGYGLILVKRMPQDVETVSGDASEAGVQKVVINDKVFILRGEKMYDVTGKAVR